MNVSSSCMPSSLDGVRASWPDDDERERSSSPLLRPMSTLSGVIPYSRILFRFFSRLLLLSNLCISCIAAESAEAPRHVPNDVPNTSDSFPNTSDSSSPELSLSTPQANVVCWRMCAPGTACGGEAAMVDKLVMVMLRGIVLGAVDDVGGGSGGGGGVFAVAVVYGGMAVGMDIGAALK